MSQDDKYKHEVMLLFVFVSNCKCCLYDEVISFFWIVVSLFMFLPLNCFFVVECVWVAACRVTLYLLLPFCE